jgi:hypothetical protein
MAIDTAARPSVSGPDEAPAQQPSRLPARKWWAALVASLTAFLTLLVTKNYDITSPEVVVALIVLIGQAVITYLVPNEGTPGGIPLRK